MKLATKIFRRSDWYVTSAFGYRKPINTSAGTTGTFHSGTDYGTNGQKWGQYAIENGTILSCGKASDGANYVWVNYPRIGKKLLHYHLDSICVKSGQSVKEGTLLGYTGTTGMSTGIHLHLGMKNSSGGNYQDPHAYDYQENVAIDPFPNVSDEELARRVWAGEFGNGQNRKNALGNRYNAVQTLVDKGVGKPTPAPEPTPAPTVDILTLVKKTIRGDFGNGQARKNALGSNYAEVQRQVNLNIKAGLTRWDNIKLF